MNVISKLVRFFRDLFGIEETEDNIVKGLTDIVERLRQRADIHDDNAAGQMKEADRLMIDANNAISKALSMRDRADRIHKAFS